MTDTPSKSTRAATYGASLNATVCATHDATFDATARATLDPFGGGTGREIIAAIKEQCRN